MTDSDCSQNEISKTESLNGHILFFGIAQEGISFGLGKLNFSRTPNC